MAKNPRHGPVQPQETDDGWCLLVLIRQLRRRCSSGWRSGAKRDLKHEGTARKLSCMCWSRFSQDHSQDVSGEPEDGLMTERGALKV